MSYHPTKDDRENLERTLHELKGILYQFLGTELDLHLVGSTAKGTWLRGEADIDIYVVHRKLSETKVWTILQEAFPEGRVKEGQLKIWSLRYGEFDVDLVLPKAGKREDTILHADYYNRNLTDAMRADIRTAKAWFKTFGVYGAEIGGIIGVAIEQLVILQKSWLGVCKLLSGPKPYVQDPTMQTPRDLLASITPKRWKVIQGACKSYLEDEGLRTFDYRPMNTEAFMKTYPDYCTIMFRRLRDRALDYQTATRVAQREKNKLRNEDHEVTIDYDVYVDSERIVICYKVEPVELSATKTRCMDTRLVTAKEVSVFRSAHPETYEMKGLLCAEVPRRITFPDTYYYAQVVKEMRAREYEHI